MIQLCAENIGFFKMESSSSTSGSTKRARAPAGVNQVVSCLVDGCKSDLSKCRDYHRRHKVCELHSKTATVTIGGREQRFCQQCSRFHSLGEFDEGKRSCRKRLEGHNRRRRKPQPDSMPIKPGNFLSGSRGSRFLAFSSSPMIPASSVVSSTWAGTVKAETNPAMYSSHSQIDVYSPPPHHHHPFRGRQFPFLQGSSSSSASANNNNPSEFMNGGGGGLNPGMDRALSLLSSSPAETPSIGLTRMPVPQNLIHSLHHYNSSAIGQMSSSDLIPNSTTSLHHCQDVFQAASDGSCSASGPQQTVSFLWE